jgi:hypothetical protein
MDYIFKYIDIFFKKFEKLLVENFFSDQNHNFLLKIVDILNTF